tara:strand:- start:373 stop:831 length:459 start_codon:yes stop_codon:yes gene_type:complete
MQLSKFILEVKNNGGINSLKLISECVTLTKNKTSEWCLNYRPEKPLLRLNTGAMEGCYVNLNGLLMPVRNNSTKEPIQNLISSNVDDSLYSNVYSTLPNAVPLFIDHKIVDENYKDLLFEYKILLLNLQDTKLRGDWAKAHSEEAIDLISNL